MGLLFFPRGGSAQVVRYLRRALRQRGWSVPLVTGSLGEPGDETHAATFFDAAGLHVMDYTDAVEAHSRGENPFAVPEPMHPSYEDRPNAPDRIFTALAPETAERLTAAWENVFAGAGLDDTDVFHLHHLTPQHEAAARLWPETPVVGHLHGTEMYMLQNIIARREMATALGVDLARMPEFVRESGGLSGLRDWSPEQQQIIQQTNWNHWRYGDYWEDKLREIARACGHLITISPYDRERAVRLLQIPGERVEWISNGVDTDRFTAQEIAPEEKLKLLQRWLVEDPRGWGESGIPGSIRYTRDQVERGFRDPDTGELYPVLIYVGRFLGFKRVPMLIRAYQRARPLFDRPAPLVVWGGSPGEWEGEHPYTVAREAGADGIFFTGWRGHDELPLGLNCADVMAAPAYREPMGQVYLEAMATGLPVIATNSGGPPSFVNVEPERPNGWLIPPDDMDALVQTLVEAVNNPAERHRRAKNAANHIRREYSWTRIAERFERVYEQVR